MPPLRSCANILRLRLFTKGYIAGCFSGIFHMESSIKCNQNVWSWRPFWIFVRIRHHFSTGFMEAGQENRLQKTNNHCRGFHYPVILSKKAFSRLRILIQNSRAETQRTQSKTMKEHCGNRTMLCSAISATLREKCSFRRRQSAMADESAVIKTSARHDGGLAKVIAFAALRLGPLRFSSPGIRENPCPSVVKSSFLLESGNMLLVCSFSCCQLSR